MALQTSLTHYLSRTKIPKIPSPTRAFSTPTPKKPSPKLVNFSLPSDSESDSETQTNTSTKPEKPNIPPPYNPFNKKPITENPQDPTNLQEVFAKIRSTDGLMNSAAKMFDGLSQLNLTHEALELFSQIKDKSQVPDVVAHTAVIEAYVDAKKAKEAHKTYLRMLASGVLPNAYTYKVVIRGLVESGDVRIVMEARRCLEEMVVRVGGEVCVGLVGVGSEGEGREVLEMVREKGVGPEEGEAREVLKGRRGGVGKMVMEVLYGK